MVRLLRFDAVRKRRIDVRTWWGGPELRNALRMMTEATTVS